MTEPFFAEMKRYVGFSSDDEVALVLLAPHAAPHYRRICDEFYERLAHHDEARRVFSGPAQIERLKVSLEDWMRLLLTGPWDQAYYERRASIGRTHVRINLPQRYMFGAMDVIRISLAALAQDAFVDDHGARSRVVSALHKIIDLELAIMLETYREAFVDKVQELERVERVILERRLALSEARYEEIVEKGEALIATCRRGGELVLFNRRCEELTGVSRAEAMTRDWLDLFARPVDREVLHARFDEVVAGRRVAPYEGPCASPVGERLLRWHFTTLPDPHEPLLCAIGLDVTEERELAARTRRVERLASLGTLAAGLAHEIRNPLNAAHLQLTLLQRRLARQSNVDLHDALGAADLAGSELKRLAGLVTEFLQFARPQPLRITQSDLRATIETVLTLLRPEATSTGVELEFEAPPRLLTEFDDERFKQVLFNLVRNGVEAAGQDGHVRVKLEDLEGEARLSIEDDGPGLPQADAPIFEPFFTTKASGTGLGLSIVHRIVSDHGGTISVTRREGWTVFTIGLPRSPRG